MTTSLTAIGLMSGTSLDGVDAAWIKTNGEHIERIGGALTLPYPPEFQRELRDLLEGKGDEAAIEKKLTEYHAEAVQALLEQEELSANDIDVIGFHGQTVLHQPEQGITRQIGDAKLLAQLTCINVVYDFRSNDVKNGGQGAPLVPVYHRALMEREAKPVAVVNIGGVANVTWIGEGEDELLAFDTGPGNALINDCVHAERGASHDEGGQIAARGKVDAHAVEQFLAHLFFAKKPPKSLDRNSFDANIPQLLFEDRVATLTQITAESIARAALHFPKPVKKWIVCGGGRHNKTLVQMLEYRLDAPVLPIEALELDGDAIEAEAFAFLAVRSLKCLALSFPNTTGVSRAATGGVFCPA